MNFKWFKEKYSSLLWWFLLIITVLIAHPSFGANIGGGITALFGLGYATYLWLNRAVKLKEILRLAAAVIGLLVLIGLWDFYLSGNLITHFGQLLIALKNNGFGVLIELIIRKWGLNARLINFSIWTYILLAIMLSVPIIYRTQAKRLAWLFEKYPAIMQGFSGMTVTGIVALLVNDSGIVTLAMLFLFAIILLLLIIFKERSLSVEIIKN